MKEIGMCKDCKWWDGDVDCIPDGTIEHFKRCRNRHFVYWGSPIDPENPAQLNDCLYSGTVDEFDGYTTQSSGEVITGPDFGCTHWEEKE